MEYGTTSPLQDHETFLLISNLQTAFFDYKASQEFKLNELAEGLTLKFQREVKLIDDS